MQTKALYVMSKEQSSGTMVVVLGLMELLKRCVGKVAFFRPIVEESAEKDEDIHLVLNSFKLDQNDTQSAGMTLSQVEEMLAQDNFKGVVETIIAKYKQLTERFDFVLCEGIGHNTLSDLIDFDIDLELAKNLSSPLVSVLSGKGKKEQELLEEIAIWRSIIESHGCTPFGIFVNRLSPYLYESLVNKNLSCHSDKPLCLLPENSELDRPTMRDVTDLLGAELIMGSPDQLSRTIKGSKVAAMKLEHFLERIQSGDLVIVPGDRSEILLGVLAANYAKSYPSLAGVVITGGLKISDSIKALLNGLPEFMLPFIGVPYDTFETSLRVKNIKARITPDDSRKIALALGLFNDNVNLSMLENALARHQVEVMTPAMFEFNLFERARSLGKTIVMPESDNERILRSAEILARRKIVKVVLLGDEAAITRQSTSIGIDLQAIQIVDPRTSPWLEEFAQTFYEMRKHKGATMDLARDIMSSVTYFATMMVRSGYADGMVSGATHTTRETILPALQIIKTEPAISLVSSIFFMCLDTRVLVYGDCAVNPDPTAEQLAEIAISSAVTAAQFGIEPKVAMLSYSTGDSGVGDDVEKVRRATQIVQERRPDLLVEGPMQYDAAIDPGVGKKKMPGSKVAGEATVFIFPDLNTGNNTYKAVQRSAKAIAIGPVLQGLKKPVNDLSRGCLVDDIINTVAITAIQAGGAE